MTITTWARVVICVLSNGAKNKLWVLTMMLSFFIIHLFGIFQIAWGFFGT